MHIVPKFLSVVGDEFFDSGEGEKTRDRGSGGEEGIRDRGSGSGEWGGR